MSETSAPRQAEAEVRTEPEVVVGGSSVPLAGLLAWLLPGLGHWYLGLRSRAVIFFVTTTATFWTGVAVGGVKSTVHPTENGAWFAAQLCAGTQAVAAWIVGAQVARVHGNEVAYTAYWPSDNIAVVYTGIAGLLNLLIVIDALARADAVVPALAGPSPPARRKTR